MYDLRVLELCILCAFNMGKALISIDKVALYVVKWNDDVMKEILL